MIAKGFCVAVFLYAQVFLGGFLRESSSKSSWKASKERMVISPTGFGEDDGSPNQAVFVCSMPARTDSRFYLHGSGIDYFR